MRREKVTEKYILKILNKNNVLELLGHEAMEDNRIEKILNKEVLLEMGLRNAIIYNFDSVISESIENVKIDLDNIMEARFFNEEKEIRVFRDEDKITGTIFAEKENSPYIEKMVLLYPRYGERRYAKKLALKKYMDYDEDNQAYIRYTKPSKLYFQEGK